MRISPAAVLLVTICLAVPERAAAQQPASTDTVVAERHEIINEREHHYTGKVELELNDTKLYADDVRMYVDQDRAVATGNVVFRQGNSQIAADRARFQYENAPRDLLQRQRLRDGAAPDASAQARASWRLRR